MPCMPVNYKEKIMLNNFFYGKTVSYGCKIDTGELFLAYDVNVIFGNTSASFFKLHGEHIREAK